MTINFSDINSAAQLIWEKLDAKDGTDNKITRTIWEQFQGTGVNAKSIKNYIEKENAIKSIRYYLRNANDQVKQNISKFLGIETEETTETEKEVETEVSEKSNEEKLTTLLKSAGLEVTDEEYIDVLSKYENKLALKESMGFTDEQIEQDIVDYVNARQKYNPIEDGFADAGRKYLTQTSNGIKISSDYAEEISDTNIPSYEIEGIQEALDYAKEHPEDSETAYQMNSEAYQRFGNSQVQLYDSDGDNQISEEEFIAYEEKRAGVSFNDEEKENAQKRFNILANSVTKDDVIDAQEMTLHGYAMAKMFDGEDKNGKNVSTGKDITYQEWLAANQAIETKATGSQDKEELKVANKYDEWVEMSKDVIYNYRERLGK